MALGSLEIGFVSMLPVLPGERKDGAALVSVWHIVDTQQMPALTPDP